MKDKAHTPSGSVDEERDGAITGVRDALPAAFWEEIARAKEVEARELDAHALFEMRGRRLRFSLPIPSKADKRFTRDAGGRPRTVDQVKSVHEQAVRSSWRALVLVIKAKLEAVDTGITTFESEFLSHIVIPGGQTFGEWAIPQIAEAYETGARMPPLLPGAPT